MGFWVNFPDWSAFSQKLISLPLCVTFYSERNDMEEEGDELVLSLSASYVFCLTFLSALLTGVGVLPFLIFGSEIPKSAMGVCNAIAAGLMTSASMSLYLEAFAESVPFALLGVATGVFCMYFSEVILEKKFGGLSIGDLDTSQSRKVILVVGAITSHAFAEGLAMGLSFAGGHMLGVFITIAMALHNIPEGIAIAVILFSRGMSMTVVTTWVTMSHMPQPVFAVIAYLYLGTQYKKTMLPLGLGFAGGAMIFIVISELIPEACQKTSTMKAMAIIMISMSIMTTFQILVLDH